MNHRLNRREFLSGTALASAGVAISCQTSPVLAAEAQPSPSTKVVFGSKGTMPTGKIGSLTVSRLISGGNLISGWAHSRDLHYVPSLMRAYNTENKILDTLQLLEEQGVNTIIADPRKNVMNVFSRYWKERGGKIQWIAEGHPDIDDWKTNMKQSIDFGAVAVYIQGVKSDYFLKEGHGELLGKCVDFIKAQGVPGGIGAHKLEVIMESEKNNYGTDFYVKTLHHTKYWSTRRPDQTQDVVDNSADNYWDFDPDKTIAFMQTVKKPWIAFKVLAAGAIQPSSGFPFAFENGADFICVGMFDFQVEKNAKLAREVFQKTQDQTRKRGWMA
jgi:hypothetical protein